MKKMSYDVISNIFCDFSLERDRPTNQPTDRASYRGAVAHLKIDDFLPSIFQAINVYNKSIRFKDPVNCFLSTYTKNRRTVCRQERENKIVYLTG